jgi:signal transduction histidine kinase
LTWDLLDRALQDIRTVSYVLHPPLLDECGLAVALRAYARGFAERSGIVCAFEADAAAAGLALPIGAATALFRVAQEALANVHRHSGATAARLALSDAGDRIELRVEDDGVGFADGPDGERKSDAAPFGVGIPGMRARLRQLGGSLAIETGRSGTTIVAVLPAGPGAEASADASRLDDAVAHRIAHEVRDRAGTELAHHRGPVRLDRLHADP